MNADELAAAIADEVAFALDIGNHRFRDRTLRFTAREAFSLAYADLTGLESSGAQERRFARDFDAAFDNLLPDDTEDQVGRMASVIATAAVNSSIVAAAPDGAEFRWQTREDDAVREIHVPLHGEVRRAGEPWMVAGVPLAYPGQPIGPPEVWINCRCSLAPVVAETAAADVLVARSYSADQRRKMADRGTAMPDGSFPIADVADLRNAIQAIGRAKDPEKAKRHIRKRARALGATDLLPDSWTASGDEDDALVVADAVEDDLLGRSGVSPPGTHDAPGWLTHPRETERLRRYWVRGPGAAKIRWGTPNDLTRCHRHLQKYVGPFAWGTCQNMHKEALGYWNPESRGRRGGGDPDEMIDAIDAAFVAAKDLEGDAMLNPPLEWFQNPNLSGPTPLTVTADGRVVGHLATWDTCHVGISGECVKPPHSKTGYAHFRTGEVETAEGETVPVGQITMDTGHADRDADPMATVAHYDNTGTAVADVAAGEDDHGIWVAGAMRPGVSEQQMYVLKATGALSGDWRRIGGNLELVAALAVNVPGFPIPRVEMAASAGRALSLVAAAVVTSDPNALEADRVAVAVIAHLDAREADRARHARAAALTSDIAALRVEALTAATR